MSCERQNGASLIKLIVLVCATPVVTAALVAAVMFLARRAPERAPVMESPRSATVRSEPVAKKEAPAVVASTPEPAPEAEPEPESGPDEPQPPVVPDEGDAGSDPDDQPVPDEEPAAAPPAVAPAGDPVDPDDQPVPPEAAVWTLDDFRSGSPLLWKTAAWENPATLRVADGGLTVEMLGGARDKTAVGRTLNMDVSGRSHVVFDIVNEMRHTLSVAVAFIVGPKSTYYESVPVSVKPGINENVAFDVRAATFKSAASKWQHQKKLVPASDVKSLYVLIYTRGKGNVTLRNVRMLPGEPVAEGKAP